MKLQPKIDNATVEGIATVGARLGIILDGFARQIQIWNTCALMRANSLSTKFKKTARRRREKNQFTCISKGENSLK